MLSDKYALERKKRKRKSRKDQKLYQMRENNLTASLSFDAILPRKMVAFVRIEASASF
jgi:translation initiation factor IF-3